MNRSHELETFFPYGLWGPPDRPPPRQAQAGFLQRDHRPSLGQAAAAWLGGWRRDSSNWFIAKGIFIVHTPVGPEYLGASFSVGDDDSDRCALIISRRCIRALMTDPNGRGSVRFPCRFGVGNVPVSNIFCLNN